MATGRDLRRLALLLEGTTESPHFDRAAFKAVRIYVTLAADGKTANFKFTPDEQEFKCMMAPEAFAAISNAWGKQGWTTATLSKLSVAELRSALEMAHVHGAATKKAKRKREPHRRPAKKLRPTVGAVGRARTGLGTGRGGDVTGTRFS